MFNHGEVVEQGTHEELLARGGLYQSMWVEQAYLGAEDNEGEEVDNARLQEASAEKQD